VTLNRLKRPTDARALALLERLDRRYRELAQALPPPIDQRALQYSTFAGRPSQEPLAGLSQMNAVVTCLPWLFWELFRELRDDLFLRIAWAGAVYGMASVLMDHLLDEQTELPGEAALLHQSLYEAAVAGYRGLFDRGSAFWSRYDRLGREHVSGMALELSARANPGVLTAEGFYALGSARIAPMLTVVAALAQAAGQPALLSTLEASIKPVIVAGQMLDDIQDWQEDLEAGRITYYLTRVIPAGAGQSAKLPAVEEVQHSIDANWSDVEHLRMVINWFDQGLSAVDGLECRAWVEYVNEYRAAAEQHQKELAAHHLLRTIASLPEGTDSGREATERDAR
jgi:hypothetical protein